MKTKLYLTIHLLALTFAPIFGQEIISQFSPSTTSFYASIEETSDGSLLIGSCTNLINRKYIVYKTTTDGIFLDSTIFYNEYQLLGIPSMVDKFLLVGFSIDNPSNIYSLKLTLIDAELNTLCEATIPIGEHLYHFWDYDVFISPDQEIIFPYSIGNGDVFHIMRIGLDFTVLEDKALPIVPRGIWDPDSTNDSVLFYTSISTFDDNPLTYQCLGFYKETNDNTIFTNYLLDHNFNPIGNTVYNPYGGSTAFTDEALTTLAPIKEEPNIVKSYLMSTYLAFPNMNATAIIKYNEKHVPIAMHKFTGTYYSVGTGQLLAKNYNTIYFTHSCHGPQTAAYITRLNGDLDITWETPLPCQTGTTSVLNCLNILQNEDILVGAILYYQNESPKLHIYIIHDDDPSGTPEAKSTNSHVELYPNPVKDVLSISYANDIKAERIELFDQTGRLVSTYHNNLERIDMKELPTGIYMMCITFDDGEKRFNKIVKE